MKPPYNNAMKKEGPILALLPLLCLSSCQGSVGVLSPSYAPDPSLPYLLRDGEAFLGFISGGVAEEPSLSLKKASLSGETLLYYFSRSSCSFCQEVEPAFSSFLEKTSARVISLTEKSSPSYSSAVSFLQLSFPEAKPFFANWGTPLLFSLKDGHFQKLELYGNHKNEQAVSKLLSGFSFPFLYELSSREGTSSFLGEGYPVLLCQTEESYSSMMLYAQSSRKKAGVLFLDGLPSSALEAIEGEYGEGERFLWKGENADIAKNREGYLSLLEEYYEG